MLQIVFLTAVGQSSAKYYSPVEHEGIGITNFDVEEWARMGMELGRNSHGIGAE